LASPRAPFQRVDNEKTKKKNGVFCLIAYYCLQYSPGGINLWLPL
jgi:hypothetical protein